MRHTNIQNLFVLFLIVCLGVCIAALTTAQKQPPPPTTIILHTDTRAYIPNMERAEYWEGKTSDYLRDRNSEMETLERQLAILNYGLSDAYDTLINQYIAGLGTLGTPLGTIASSIIQLRKNEQIWEIKKMLMRKYAAIAAKQLSINNQKSPTRIY